MDMLLKDFVDCIRDGRAKDKVAVIYQQDDYYVYTFSWRTYSKTMNRFSRCLGYTDELLLKAIMNVDKNAVIIAPDVINFLKSTLKNAEDIQNCLKNANVVLNHNMLKDAEIYSSAHESFIRILR